MSRPRAAASGNDRHDQIAAGDAAGATRRFFEDAVLGPAAGRSCPSRSGPPRPSSA